MKNRYILLLFTLFFVVTGSVAQDGAVSAGLFMTKPGITRLFRV